MKKQMEVCEGSVVAFDSCIFILTLLLLSSLDFEFYKNYFTKYGQSDLFQPGTWKSKYWTEVDISAFSNRPIISTIHIDFVHDRCS